MNFTDVRLLDDDVLERRFVLDDVPGMLWTRGDAPAPLLLVGHPGGLDAMYPRIAGRARFYVARHGFAAAAVELPGSGDRPRIPALEEARGELRRAMAAGESIDAIVDALVLPLVDRAVPEWQRVLDALLALPGVDGPVGIEGGVFAAGIRMALVEPRVGAALLYAGSFVPAAIRDEARQVAVPVQVLLQWDDAGGNRQEALDVFDALGSAEKSLHANLGGHTGVPAHELDSGAAFFDRHLRGSAR